MELGNKLSRRDFLKISATILGLGALDACGVPQIATLLANTPQPPDTATKLATQINKANPTLVENPATATPEPTKGWKFSNPEDIKSILSNPNFFKLQDSRGRPILPDQFDIKQYMNLDAQYLPNFNSCDYPGNACGPDLLVAFKNTFNYLKTGNVLNDTVGDEINWAMKQNRDGFVYITPKGIQMEDFPFMWALEDMGKQTGLFRVVSDLTPEWSLANPNHTHIIPESEWGWRFQRARKEVLDGGGALALRVLDEKGVAHFIGVSSINAGGEPLILDPDGGSAKTVGLGNYVGRAVDPAAPDLGNQPALFWMIGLVPTF
jgi:hypothetical protein